MVLMRGLNICFLLINKKTYLWNILSAPTSGALKNFIRTKVAKLYILEKLTYNVSDMKEVELAYRVDSDEVAHEEPSHQYFHCLNSYYDTALMKYFWKFYGLKPCHMLFGALRYQKADNKIFICKFSKKVKSKLYHIENSKTRGQTV